MGLLPREPLRGIDATATRDGQQAFEQTVCRSGCRTSFVAAATAFAWRTCGAPAAASRIAISSPCSERWLRPARSRSFAASASGTFLTERLTGMAVP